MENDMKMNEFIARLKQQPRIGGVPLRPVSISSLPTSTPAAVAIATTQVQQLAQQLANQMVAEI